MVSVSHVLFRLPPGAVRAGDCSSMPVSSWEKAKKMLTCAFPHPLGGWFSVWQLCLGQSPSCSAWCESLEKVSAGWGVEWGMGLLQQKCVWRKSLVLSFFCGNLESYHQNILFVFRRPLFSLKVYEHKNVCPALQKK